MAIYLVQRKSPFIGSLLVVYLQLQAILRRLAKQRVRCVTFFRFYNLKWRISHKCIAWFLHSTELLASVNRLKYPGIYTVVSLNWYCVNIWVNSDFWRDLLCRVMLKFDNEVTEVRIRSDERWGQKLHTH